MMMLRIFAQEVIGPPAVSVTTADVFRTIEAEVELFLFKISLYQTSTDIDAKDHLVDHDHIQNVKIHLHERSSSSRLMWSGTSARASQKR